MSGERTRTGSDDSSARVKSVSWGEIDNYTGSVQSSVSLSYTDVTLYYELLDNWTEIDAGFTFRSLEGDMSLITPSTSDDVSYSQLIPMLYGKARFNIPASDLSLQAEVNVVSFSGLTSYDYALSARYSFLMGVGLEAGYKTFYLESDDLTDNFKTDMDFSGPYLLAIWDF